MAVAIGQHHPDGPRSAIDDRLVRRWATGAKRIPDWAWSAFLAVLQAEANALDARAGELRQMVERLGKGKEGGH